MLEKSVAVIGLLACLAVWAGMALGASRRQRLKAWALRLWQRLRNPLQARRARHEAQEAIERARRTPRAERDGNVYRPDRFHPGRGGRDKLH